MRLILALLSTWWMLHNNTPSVLKIKSVAVVMPIEIGYDLGHDSMTVYKGRKYVVTAIETFNKNGKPTTIQERHSEGFASWPKEEFKMLIKDSPEQFMASGRVLNFNGIYLNINTYKLIVIDHDERRHLLVCRYGKTTYFINYY